MKDTLKRIAARLPKRVQQSMKRRLFASQIRAGRFITAEPEFELSSQLLSEGDWVLDIGANVGHYTLEFSRLVGRRGRVIAFEPVPETFELLAANVAYAGAQNVTLINAAASDAVQVLGMSIPKFESGLDNLYMAHIDSGDDGLSVLCLPVDSLGLEHRIRLVKIDAEGHDLLALRGMEAVLRRDRPTLYVEESSDEVRGFLRPVGYSMRRLPGSPNSIFEPEKDVPGDSAPA